MVTKKFAVIIGEPYPFGKLRAGSQGLKTLRENRRFRIESRRACPELVERGRLKITQDAILGYL
jgi:hypothetical protein